jgi:pimeloyl-ACP methyl ester carboxylesterase
MVCTSRSNALSSRRARVFAWTLFVLVAVPTLYAADGPDQVPRIEKSGCVRDVAKDEAIDCYTLVTFENHAKHSGATVRLPFILFHSRSPHPAPDPILFTAGGPGGSTLMNLASGKNMPFLDDRDYIGFEQRGTLYARPSLQCPEYLDATVIAGEQNADESQTAQLKLAAASACKARLVAKGIDLSAYNTAETVDDIEDLRRLLAIPQWNCVGLSYSTRIVLEMMRRYSGTVRSAILDSVLPPDAAYDEFGVANIYRALQLVLNNCAVDIRCARAYPDPSTLLTRAMYRIETDSPTLTLKSIRDGKPIAFRVLPRNVMDAMYDALSSPGTIPQIPSVLWHASNGDYRALQELLQDNLGAPGFAWGMRISVWCHDNPSLADAAQNTLGKELGGFFRVAIPANVCREWDVPALQIQDIKPVVSSIPTLIFAGEYDPNTPTEAAFHTAKTLKAAYVVLVPGRSHGQLSLDANCGKKMVTEFLRDPTRMPPSDCEAQLAKPDFVIDH